MFNQTLAISQQKVVLNLLLPIYLLDVLNLKETDGKKKIQYNLLCDMAKVWSNVTLKRFMHKIGFKDFVFDLQKFVLFHLMDKISFNLPHTIYINFLRGMKTL